MLRSHLPKCRCISIETGRLVAIVVLFICLRYFFLLLLILFPLPPLPSVVIYVMILKISKGEKVFLSCHVKLTYKD